MLVTPERFLKRAFAENERTLAILIYKKLQIELDPKSETSEHFISKCSNLFTLAFCDPKQAQEMFQMVQKRCETSAVELGITECVDAEFVFLPPLFLLANDDFVIRFNDILIFASKHGPIIPVIQLQTMREQNILDNLILIYSKNCANFVDLDSMRDLLVARGS